MRTVLPALAASALALGTLSCAGLRGGSGTDGSAATAGGAMELVERALAAQGGVEAVAALRTLSAKGAATFWEPEQSVTPGGESRFAGDATFVVASDLVGGNARIEWAEKLAYPSPREFRFTEIVTPTAGAVEGVDSGARTKQSQDSNPPRHAMSGVRLATAQRELLRTSPRLLLDLRANPTRVARVADVQVAGATLPAVSYRAGDVTFVILFDPSSGLPARIRTLDADNIQGDSSYDLVLGEWRAVSGVRLPHSQRYELNGSELVRIRLDEVTSGAALAAGSFEIAPELRATAARPATGPVPYQWVLRRQHIGLFLDSDAIHHDPQASPGLRLVEVAPGVQHFVGGTHNSLVVELDDALAVVDAPIDERQSRLTIDAAKARYPGKPVRYLVLTHHHMDHAGGLRTYVAEGATLVVGAGAGAHFRRVLAAPDRLSGGALANHPRRPELLEVADRTVLGTGARTLEAYRIDNPHVAAMLMPYVPQARIAFVADLWSPGREKVGEVLTPGQAAIVAAVRKAGISPERFAGGHGAVGEYAPLAALAKP